MTANNRLMPTFSPRSGIDNSVIKIGATKKRAVAVARGSVAIAEKRSCYTKILLLPVKHVVSVAEFLKF